MSERPFDEQWAPLLSGLIARSPPGHLVDVVAGCKQLTRAPIPKELIGRACSDHNELHLLVLPLGPESPGTLGIVCESGRRGSRAQRLVPYLEPRSDHVFVVDQEQQECASVQNHVQKTDLMAEVEGIDDQLAAPFRKALQHELDVYVADRFPPATMTTGEGHSAGAAFNFKGKDVGGGDIELHIVVSSGRTRPRGFWAGSWGSTWRILFVAGQAEPAKLTGLVEFTAHYAEDGNVHFARRVRKTAVVKETEDPAKFASEVVAAIILLEDEAHEAAEDSCSSFGVGPLKSMRRVLPVSKQRFDWRPTRQALVRDMKNATKEGVC